MCVYGPRHREYRRLLFSGLAPRKAEEWHSVHEQKTREYLGMLLDRPEDFMAHIRRCGSRGRVSQSFAMRSAY